MATPTALLGATASHAGSAGPWSRLPASYAFPKLKPSLPDAQAYCRTLATSHYENFSVATWFLPKRLRQHFCNIYSYCRIADDLGDEAGDRDASLKLLSQWEDELNACYAGNATHPVLVAMAETVHMFEIPKHEFSDLLVAFREDQRKTRFADLGEVLAYCRNSANPVGHLVLYLCGYKDAERQRLADYTCTALQLANFWQDVSADYAKGRIYLPLEDMAGFNVSEEDIAKSRNTPQFCELMKFEVERARDYFKLGLPLIGKVAREVAVDIELFSRGGQEILNAIEKQQFKVLGRRPVISKPRKIALVARAGLGRLL